ncbi:MAG TPA: hypothetical protein VGD97_06660 [Lacunisphaera sp.]
MWKPLTRDQLEQSRSDFSGESVEVQCQVMAHDVIIATLGPDFWKRHCTRLSDKNSYFNPKGETTLELNFHRDCVLRLGDMLYSMRETPGYSHFIHTLGKQDLDSAFFELKAAHAFHFNGHPIVFVQRSGTKSEDYDLSSTISDKTTAIEAKFARSKINDNAATVRNQLSKARGQLPRDRPGIICLYTQTHIESSENIRSTIDQFLKKETNVTHVILFRDQFNIDQAGSRVSSVEEMPNLASRHSVQNKPLLGVTRVLDFRNPDRGLLPSFW